MHVSKLEAYHQEQRYKKTEIQDKAVSEIKNEYEKIENEVQNKINIQRSTNDNRRKQEYFQHQNDLMTLSRITRVQALEELTNQYLQKMMKNIASKLIVIRIAFEVFWIMFTFAFILTPKYTNAIPFKLSYLFDLDHLENPCQMMFKALCFILVQNFIALLFGAIKHIANNHVFFQYQLSVLEDILFQIQVYLEFLIMLGLFFVMQQDYCGHGGDLVLSYFLYLIIINIFSILCFLYEKTLIKIDINLKAYSKISKQL